MSLSYKIRKAEEEDFSELARIYKSSFKRHNIMGMEETEVINYLLKSNKINSKLGGGYFIAVDSNEKVLGGILLKKKNQDLKGTHYIWKLNHLAVDLEYRGQGIGKKLVNSALNRIEDLIKSEKFKTAKV